MLKGVDVSSWQGDIDFHTLKDNADFVIIRSTYGNGYKDANFEKNRDGARAAGLGIGFYHFAYPQYNSPEDEATWFTKTVSCLPGELLVLDFEEPISDPVGWCKRFLDKTASNMGFKPLIYLDLSMTQSFDWSPIIKENYGLWLAHYDGNTDIVDPIPWHVAAMKQYRDTGSVPGINGDVDLDVFYGDMDVFKKYGNPPPVSQSQPTDTVTPPTISPETNSTTPPVQENSNPTSNPNPVITNKVNFLSQIREFIKELVKLIWG